MPLKTTYYWNNASAENMPKRGVHVGMPLCSSVNARYAPRRGLLTADLTLEIGNCNAGLMLTADFSRQPGEL